MLKRLKLENVGPAAKMELDLGSRLNIITGDNGLGKSFLLDVAWFVNMGGWPLELNPQLTNGFKALPRDRQQFSIVSADIESLTIGKQLLTHVFKYQFDRRAQSWLSTGNSDLARVMSIYAMADGGIAIYDPLRNWNPSQILLGEHAPNLNRDNLQPAFVFSQFEIWNGLHVRQKDKDEEILCNGLIRDWASWQNKNGRAFKVLRKVLEVLSPDQNSPIRPGKELTRISINDVRDMPTIVMPYDEGLETAVVHASAAIKRIISIAYLLVWMWEEHLRVSEITGYGPSNEIQFLIDEVECHLHPSWQRKIVPALLEAVSELSKDLQVQLIATTHSPLVMASLEPHFDAEKDAWFDLDLVRDNGSKPDVVLTKRPFEKMGSANGWLVSEAFDLEFPFNIPHSEVIKEASAALRAEDYSAKDARILDQKIQALIDPKDPFWTKWKMLGKQKGWWQ